MGRGIGNEKTGAMAVEGADSGMTRAMVVDPRWEDWGFFVGRRRNFGKNQSKLRGERESGEKLFISPSPERES